MNHYYPPIVPQQVDLGVQSGYEFVRRGTCPAQPGGNLALSCAIAFPYDDRAELFRIQVGLCCTSLRRIDLIQHTSTEELEPEAYGVGRPRRDAKVVARRGPSPLGRDQRGVTRECSASHHENFTFA
jgi:hypothetical protein